MNLRKDMIRATAGVVAIAMFHLPLASAASAPAAPQLTAEASEMLANAEAAVQQAREKSGLWTTAAAALAQAREAGKNGDSATVIAHSREAVEWAALGMAQTGYPLTVSP